MARRRQTAAQWPDLAAGVCPRHDTVQLGLSNLNRLCENTVAASFGARLLEFRGEMARITFIEPDGTRKEVEGTAGDSVMRTAVNHGIAGIVAECGGCLSCGTCHAYVGKEWLGRLTPPSSTEELLIECVLHVRPNSRLTCQIAVTEELDGLLIEIPEAQY